MLSKYNLYYRKDSAIWIYNNAKKKIICLSLEEFEQAQTGKLEHTDQRLYKKLSTFGMVTNSKQEEADLLQEHQNQIENSKLELMIMASTACNFNCSYCYEEFEPKTIDERFEDIFVQFMQQNVHKYIGVFLDWFGGEPLLARERIISISKKVKEICNQQKKPYLGSITTNGYYLDYSTFLQLIEGNVIYLQVTVDGNKEWHDMYRPLKNGTGTYEVIINHLLEIKKKVDSTKIFRLTIRNNVSEDNFVACKEFQQFFNEHFGDDNRFQLFQFPIKDWGGTKIDDLQEKLLLEDYISMQDTKNIRNDMFESIVSASCLASKKNGYVIDPDYKVYKCNHFIQGKKTKQENEVGVLSPDAIFRIDEERNACWYIPKIHETCIHCEFLPSCLTKCPIVPIEPSPSCQEEKGTILMQKIESYVKSKENT